MIVITDGLGLSIIKAKCNVSVCLLSTKLHNKESLLGDALVLVSLTAFPCFHLCQAKKYVSTNVKSDDYSFSPGLNQHLNAMNVLTVCAAVRGYGFVVHSLVLK